jgi:hypothetical protein
MLVLPSLCHKLEINTLGNEHTEFDFFSKRDMYVTSSTSVININFPLILPKF